MDSDGDFRMTDASGLYNKESAPPSPRSSSSSPLADDELFERELDTVFCDLDDNGENPLSENAPVPNLIEYKAGLSTTSPPCAGLVFVSDRILSAALFITGMATSFGMTASTAYRAIYMFAYIVQQDGVTVNVARSLPDCFLAANTTKNSPDIIIALLCLRIVSDQDALEVYRPKSGPLAVPSWDQTAENVWIDRISESAHRPKASHQPHCMSLGGLVASVVTCSPSSELWNNCTSWIREQYTHTVGAFGWVITPTLLCDARVAPEVGFSKGVWDPAMDTFHNLRIQSTFLRNEHWLRTQLLLMEDLSSRDILAFYLSVSRQEASCMFGLRHDFMFVRRSKVVPSGLLFSRGSALAECKRRARLRRTPPSFGKPFIPHVCRVST